jgi:hypothetical protein
MRPPVAAAPAQWNVAPAYAAPHPRHAQLRGGLGLLGLGAATVALLVWAVMASSGSVPQATGGYAGQNAGSIAAAGQPAYVSLQDGASMPGWTPAERAAAAKAAARRRSAAAARAKRIARQQLLVARRERRLRAHRALMAMRRRDAAAAARAHAAQAASSSYHYSYASHVETAFKKTMNARDVSPSVAAASIAATGAGLGGGTNAGGPAATSTPAPAPVATTPAPTPQPATTTTQTS